MTARVEDGGPAFPTEVGPLGGFQSGNERWTDPGMSLRDYFAAKALASLIRIAPSGTSFGPSNAATNENYALVAYSMADAMLTARAR